MDAGPRPHRFKTQRPLMKGLCQKAGVKYFRYHALRHLGASILNNLGVDRKTIQGLLRHKNPETTDIYLQSIEDAPRDAMEAYEKEVSHQVSHQIKKGLQNIL